MRELAYLANPSGKPGKWFITDTEGKEIEFTFSTHEEAQDKFDELLSEED